MFKRDIAEKLLELSRSFPVVSIEGPRQSGKTTLAKMVFPSYGYVNLEDFSARELAKKDARGFFEKFPPPVIVDEIQRVPELLSEIQVRVDRSGANGEYVLTGSHQPKLREGVAQTLAGRTALLTLLPLSIAELSGGGVELTRDEYIFRGFLPAIYDRGQNPADAYEAYYRTYVERDVRQLVNLTRQGEFELFLRLLAGRVGQVINLEGMSGEIGVGATTLKQWLSVLEASFVVYRLRPYYKNFGKRFVKSPKLYFTDVGLAAHLLQIESAAQVMRDPLLGGLFENMVVMEAVKAQLNAGKAPALYYMRDKSGAELDLVLEERRKLYAMEIKCAFTPDASMAKNFAKYAKIADALETARVVYAGEDWKLNGVEYVNFKGAGCFVR